MTWLNNTRVREEWISFVQSMNPEIDPRAIALIDQLHMVSRAIHHVSRQSLDGAGLSFAQYKILMHLFFSEKMGGQPDLNPSEISNRQGVTRNTISSLIRSLEEEGLVERRLDPDDRRRFNISLTDAGRSLVDEYARQHLAMIGSCITVLSTEEQETLSTLLRRVSSHIHEGHPNCD